MFDTPTQYCERLIHSSGLEPFNVLSSAAFIIAAIFAYYHLRKKSGLHSIALPVLLGLVGVGSFWRHIAAGNLGDLADTLGILLFASVIGVIILNKIFDSKITVTLTFLLLVGSAVAADNVHTLNGSLPYLVLLIAFVGTGGVLIKKKYIKPPWVLSAGGVFILAIIFRTLDLSLCSYLNIGTHFLWHIFMALFGYQLILITNKIILPQKQIPND